MSPLNRFRWWLTFTLLFGVLTAGLAGCNDEESPTDLELDDAVCIGFDSMFVDGAWRHFAVDCQTGGPA